ncbi:hypothetical protein CEXT_246991 [Caerostris extrusa]|uniref:Uncharacterized protein n=1 Tax=Caerostris extrusa TaxID=172846 RepID=A0AAV4WUP9_CAEEX|nr:hypothetical protein CEXT_246991 [Caerostris extrusa]
MMDQYYISHFFLSQFEEDIMGSNRRGGLCSSIVMSGINWTMLMHWKKWTYFSGWSTRFVMANRPHTDGCSYGSLLHQEKSNSWLLLWVSVAPTGFILMVGHLSFFCINMTHTGGWASESLLHQHDSWLLL